MSLSERDKQVIWHPYTQMQTADNAIPILKGEGTYIYGEDGTKYLDMISSWWVTIHGHSHPYIAERISRQLSILEHVIFAGFTHEPAIELAEKLLALLSHNFSKVFYSDNGSTAVEVGLKMALQYWHNQGKARKTIIALKGAYHGDTFGAMSVSGRSIFTQPFAEMLFEVKFVDTPVPGKEAETIRQLREILAEKKDDVAAFIFEPLVQGTAGMVMYEPIILDEMLALLKSHQVICIADEVMTGFGRTGKIFATDHLSQKPDIICLSKGLTGGTLPLGVTACTENIYAAFLSEEKVKALFHGHSFTANPLACTAALASMELLLKPECLAKIAFISQAHIDFAKEIKSHPRISEARSRGTILALELKTAENTSYFNNLRDYLNNFFLERNILIRPLGNILYLIPPYCVSESDLERTYQTIRELLDNL
jgi:adenosylmethionine-8-amino-7-oxononanoate aminotransferase